MRNSKIQLDNAATSQRKQTRRSQAGVTSVALMEPLESRQMMSATPAVFQSAVALGNVSASSQLNTHGVVGGSVVKDVYSFNATQPLTLNATLGNLKQTDVIGVFNPDGSIVTSATSAGSTLKISQPLTSGKYFVEVSSIENQAAVSTAGVPSKISSTIRNFTLQLAGAKYAPSNASKNAGAGVFSDGAISEPLTMTQGQQQHGVINMTYSDVANASLFGTTGFPSPDDVIQGICGDCWFLSTLSSIARVDSGLIEHDIVSLGNDQYKVEFGNSWINIDGTLPHAISRSGNSVLAFAQVPSDGALWAPLMEKAFCYFRNAGAGAPSYATIEGGHGDEALRDLNATNISEAGTPVAAYFGYKATMSNGAQLASQINLWSKSNQTIVLDTLPEGYTSSLVGGHQYSIVGIDSTGNVELRNPWGNDPVSVANPNGPQRNDGGYITLSPQAVFNDCAMMFAGVMPQVAPAPIHNPTPAPTTFTTGTVFVDLNNDNTPDAGDPRISGVRVYATPTLGAQYQPGDPTALTDANGTFTINGLTVGTTYYIYEVTPANYSNSSGFYNYTPQAGSNGYDDNFGNVLTNTSTVSGAVFADKNNNGALDSGDTGLAGVAVYATTTLNAQYQSGDQYAWTDANGNYVISGLKQGTTYYIYEISPAGYSNTSGFFNYTPQAGFNGGYDNFANVQVSPT